jgi:hypothetical protein
MNCTSCGANLPPGAAQCPLCGNPTPYNAARPASSPQYDPTVVAPQPGPGGSPQIDPTVISSPYGGTPTPYGTPPYGAPPPPPSPYSMPPVAPNQYDVSSPQQNLYGTPPLQQGGYVAPPPQQGGAYGYGTPPPPKRRSRLGLILGIVALMLVLACAGISFAIYQGLKQTGSSLISSVNATLTASAATATSVSNTTPTGTTPTTSGAPSGLSIDPAAASIITNAQMASGVDSNFNPTTVTSTFVTKQTIYATFKIDPNAPSDGFVQGKWYSDGTFAFTSKTLAVKADFVGYLSAEYNIPTQGTVELYWCVQSDCSDAKLADVVNFTVTAASIRGIPLSALAFMDINRP